jgi:hypothetical protein
MPGLAELALDATHAYWVTDGQYGGTASLWRLPRAGGPAELLYTLPERVYSLALDETHIYFTRTASQLDITGGSIQRLPKGGGEVEVLVDTFWNPTAIAVDATHVYYNLALSYEGEIRRVPKAGGAWEPVADSLDNPWDLAVQGGYVYISEMNAGRIVRVPVEGGALEVVSAGWPGTESLAVDGSHVYFASQAAVSPYPITLLRVPLAGGTAEPVFDAAVGGKIAVSAHHLQWGPWFVPLDGGDVLALADPSAPNDRIFSTAASDAQQIFIGEYYSGDVYAIDVPAVTGGD